MTKTDYEKLAAFRHELCRFQRFSENAVRSHGIASMQCLALLAIEDCPGRDWLLVGALAEQLQTAPHSTVELVNRLEKAGEAGSWTEKIGMER